MGMNATVQLIGDYGNPTGSGLAKLAFFGLTSADVATALTDMDTFADSLKTGAFTGCEIGDVAVTETTVQYKAKPASGINVDRQLVCQFRTMLDATTRKLTISGVEEGSAILELTAQGERLTDAGKTTLAGYINTLLGYDGIADGAIVLYGKVLQKS